MGKALTEDERKLFLSICLPSLKGNATREIKARLLYTLKKGELTDKDLETVFPREFEEIQEMVKKRPRISLFDKTNYILKYFLEVYNPRKRIHKIEPAQIIGFKAERQGQKNIMHAKVRYYDGRVEDSSLEVFPTVSLAGFNLSDYVLINQDTICHVLSPLEYKQIVDDYF
jgi:hypothetical protein